MRSLVRLIVATPMPARECWRRSSLPTRHSLEQDVPARQGRDQQQADGPLLTDHDPIGAGIKAKRPVAPRVSFGSWLDHRLLGGPRAGSGSPLPLEREARQICPDGAVDSEGYGTTGLTGSRALRHFIGERRPGLPPGFVTPAGTVYSEPSGRFPIWPPAGAGAASVP